MRKTRRGFTLIEAMIVVVVIGVLAVVAAAAYRRWVLTAYLSEAQDMVKSIRAAQEAFRAENGGYINVSAGLGPSFDYPAHPPTQGKTGWGGSCGWCAKPNGWAALNVASSGPLIFGYSTIADVNGTPASPTGVTLSVNGTALDLSNMKPPWYIVEADGDVNGNGVFCNVYGTSVTNQIYINNEGE